MYKRQTKFTMPNGDVTVRAKFKYKAPDNYLSLIHILSIILYAVFERDSYEITLGDHLEAW